MSNTFTIRDNIHVLSGNADKLKSANQVFVDAIQTISAISEEATAHAGETMHAEEENTDILNKVSQKMQELIELTKHFKNEW